MEKKPKSKMKRYHSGNEFLYTQVWIRNVYENKAYSSLKSENTVHEHVLEFLKIQGKLLLEYDRISD